MPDRAENIFQKAGAVFRSYDGSYWFCLLRPRREFEGTMLYYGQYTGWLFLGAASIVY